MSNHRPKMLGILGGMGPLASAEFLKTIYEYNLPLKSEQDTPKVILYSDPSFPDRTELLLKGNEIILQNILLEVLPRLIDLGVTKIIICCITYHYFLPRLPQELTQDIISLVDVILNSVLESPQSYLLLCTKGTIQHKIFQNHPLWNNAKKYICLPNLKDRELIHNTIYKIKQQGKIVQAQDIITHLKLTYKVDALIAGCTELHLLSKSTNNIINSNVNNNRVLDPLILIAQKLKQYL